MSCAVFLRRISVQEERLLSPSVLSGYFLPCVRSSKDAEWEVEVEQRERGKEFRERLVAGWNGEMSWII